MGGNVMMAYARFRLGLLALVAAGFGFFAHVADAQQYNRFGPANGILVGQTTTPQTTAATSTNVISLWTATCNASTFLRGDGSCQTPTGTGVTSVALTMPSGFSVAGSPITTSGTFAVTTLLNGIILGNGSGFTTATSANVISLWTGTCDATTFLRGDGSCQVAGGGTSGANPTAVIGLTAVNGVSTNFLRSDGAPALSQAIAPTWSAQHIFSVVDDGGAVRASSTVPVIGWNETDGGTDNKVWREVANGEQFCLQTRTDANGAGANAICTDRTGTTIDNVSFPTATAGAFSIGGAGASGASAVIRNAATNFNPLAVCADGQSSGSRCWQVRIGSGADLQINTADNNGTFTAGNSLQMARAGTTSLTSIDITPRTGTFSVDNHSGGSCTVAYSSIGRLVTWTVGTAGTCTGTSADAGGPFTCTGCVPVALRPTTTKRITLMCLNNTADAYCVMSITSAGTLNSGCGASPGAGCTASGTKGISPAASLTYGLD